MCQQIALRIWTDRQGTHNIAFHPKSRLELREEHAYLRMHNLNSILLGEPDRILTLDDIKAVVEPMGVLLLELPQREIGGQLPSWEALIKTVNWAREHNLPIPKLKLCQTHHIQI